MLTASYLVNVAAPMVDLWGQVEADILADIARRLIKGAETTDTAAWQTLKLREMGVLQTDIAHTLASTLRRSEEQLYKMVVDACKEALAFDDALYQKAGLNPIQLSQSKALMDLISAGIRRTEGVMRNFTGTTAIDSSKAFANALDRAWLQVNSGAFTRQEALRRAVEDLSKKGINGVAYPSGHRDKMDVAARRALVTGINQTVANVQLARADEMGCDLVEVTSHAGARPTHAVWQGEVYSRSGKHPHYKNFYDETGYGTGDGLCGWNCYHSFYPYFEGISTQAFERDPSARLGKTNDQVYEESQTQRYYERKIRESKRELAAYDAARKATQDPAFKEQLDAEFAHSSVLLKRQEAALKEFCRKTNRTMIPERSSVYGFGRSESSKAVWAARKTASVIAPSSLTRRRIGANGQEIIDQATYASLTRSFINAGGLIIRGKEAEDHLSKVNAYAAYLPSLNTAIIRDDATVSDVLEEMYHAKQDRRGDYADLPQEEMVLRREIDAQKYLISVIGKYKIPVEQTRQTKENLRHYEDRLERLLSERR